MEIQSVASDVLNQPAGSKTGKPVNPVHGTYSFAQILDKLSVEQSATHIAETAAPLSKIPVTVSSSALNGDYISSLKIQNPTIADTRRTAQGAAAGSVAANTKKIDKTSKLYEQALELESYFVKIMLNTMKNTLNGGILGQQSFAGKLYRDMMFDELSRTVTRNAGFGLADQIYLQLV